MPCKFNLIQPSNQTNILSLFPPSLIPLPPSLLPLPPPSLPPSSPSPSLSPCLFHFHMHSSIKFQSFLPLLRAVHNKLRPCLFELLLHVLLLHLFAEILSPMRKMLIVFFTSLFKEELWWCKGDYFLQEIVKGLCYVD